MKPKLLALLTAAAAVVLPTATASAATPGVNIAGAPTADRVSEAIATGAKTVRIFALWKDFEPDARGQFPATDVNHANTVAVYDAAIRQLNAAGAKPLFVMTEAPPWANGSTDPLVQPSDFAAFGDFLGRFAAHNKAVGSVAGYEVWNEPDEANYWHGTAPNVATYASMLKAAYPAIHAADPSAKVVAAPTTGNNYAWYQGLYDNGAGQSFDVAAVHTDTACLDRGPDQFYRDDLNKLARYTFLGYRSVRDVMVANGDAAKPIWMTELGWSSTNGGPTSCTRGDWAGKKPSGVTDAAQAQYLTAAYACLANDPYVEQADWFTLRDDPTQAVEELRHYGLLTGTGAPKPALATFRTVAAAGGGAAGACGDFDPPTIRIVKPAPGTQFIDKLDVQAAATDGGVGLTRITFGYDGANVIRNFGQVLLTNDKPVGLSPWFGSSRLPLGKHTITVYAVDKNGNVGSASVEVEKVATLASTLTPTVKIKSKRIRCKKGTCSFKGVMSRGKAGTPTITGKVAVEWQFKNKKGKWVKLIGGLRNANKAFTFTANPKFHGNWRVRAVYQGMAPWKATTSKWVAFRF